MFKHLVYSGLKITKLIFHHKTKIYLHIFINFAKFHEPKGNSVINFVIANEEERGEMYRLRVDERVESNHQLLVFEVGKRRKKSREEEIEVESASWRLGREKKKWIPIKNGRGGFQARYEDVDNMLDEIIKEVKSYTKVKRRRKRWIV